MKKAFASAAVLLMSSSAVYAATPDAVANAVASCCAALAACCGLSLPCCP
ncbi:hypothetical protein [Allosphingosinicella sp.]